ncbi:MAG TPA: helix-turn-helix domain-containing protein [Acidimicrobiales bacterium]|nr:helix-turn-helix domain-containing protein [Acidimicrobiales bacterium]
MPARTPAPSRSARLPRGRHGLSRSEVAHAQRSRMLRAMADAMVEKGYAGTSVADVIRRAGVSRETFYQQFSSKAECFMEAYDAAVGLLLTSGEVDAARDVVAGGAPVSEGERLARFAELLDLYLSALASEPAFARLFLLEVYAAGPEAMARRAAAQERFADLVATLLGAATPEARFACETLVAAVSSMVTSRLAALDLDGLRALDTPIMELVERARRGPILPS